MRLFAGETREKKEFSARQLQLPKHNPISCRHCNEPQKFAAKDERRRSLDGHKDLKGTEIHNQGQGFVHTPQRQPLSHALFTVPLLNFPRRGF